jgi:2-oxoacid:acceptor oxidoreductase delta subunit (pyruvate/2-ketoisovalerate family)
MSGKKGWKELPIGGVIPEGGTSEAYATGGWRTFRPVLDPKKCTNCLICWIFCPDSSIRVVDGKHAGFDLAHCKGCGICAEECPSKIKAITMVEETQFKKEGVCHVEE